MDSDCPFCRLDAGAIPAIYHVADFAHSTAWIHPNQTLRGRTTLIARGHCTDMLELAPETYAGIAGELRVLAGAIQRAFAPARMNYANYGNVVPHLHWHVVPRYRDDPWWGGPPSLVEPAERLADGEYQNIASMIRSHLPALPTMGD
jgi:diadenosine tetraphosphate (Ap4A) HIT family hydrolase